MSGPSPSGRLLHGLWLAGVALALAAALAGAAETGEFSGRVFTAEHPDSVAPGAVLTLAHRDSSGGMGQVSGTSAADGSFCFSELATEPSTIYILQVEYRGNVSVGAPVRFSPGESALRFDVVIGGNPLASSPDPSAGGARPPENPGGSTGLGGVGLEGTLPPGHPAIPGATPPVPVAENPVHTILLTLALATLFGLPLLLVSRKDRQRERRRAARTTQSAGGMPRAGEGYGG